VGFADIEDVNDYTSAKIDDMESSWFAEGFKYLCVEVLQFPADWLNDEYFRYLTFDDPKHISIDECEFQCAIRYL